MGEYRVVLCAPPTAADAGEPIAELDTAKLTGVEWELNQPGLATFTMPVDNSKNTQVKLLETEVRVYRNGFPIFWGVPLRARSDSKITEFQCPGLLWYLTKRHVGDAQRPNHLFNASFESGADIDGSTAPQGWTEGSDSIERIQVRTTNGAQRGDKVLTLTESRTATYTNPKTKKTSQVPRHSHLYQLVGGNVALVPGQRYTFAAWFRIHEWNGPSFQDRGIFLRCYRTTDNKDLTQPATYKIDKDTTVGEWIRAEVSLRVPRGVDPANTRLRASLYCPKGVISWDATRVNVRDFLLRDENDLTVAAKALVAHAQDPAFQKTTLGITATGANVGVLTNKRFPHDEHQQILEALHTLTKGSGGIDFEVSENNRDFVIHASKGTHRAEKTLELGRNIAEFELIEDGEQTANSVVMLAEGSGADREESYARSLGLFSGMAYEAVIPTRTHLKELHRRAKEHVARRNRLVKIPSVTTHPHADNLIDVLKVGDTVPLRIDHGRVQVNQTVRIYGLELDPATDTLTVRTNA